VKELLTLISSFKYDHQLSKQTSTDIISLHPEI